MFELSLDSQRNLAEGNAIKLSKLALDLVFSWSLSAIVSAAGLFASSVIFTQSNLFPTDPPELATACVSVIEFGLGAFLLGTLARKSNLILLATLFVAPLLLLLPGTATTFPALTIPLISVLACFIGSMCAIAAGQTTDFNRGKSALNIPWYHWLWLFPTTLFQTACVPFTLFFALFQTNQPAIRVGIMFVLPLVMFIIYTAARLLAKQSKLNWKERVALVFSWIFLTAPQVLLIVVQAGKDYPNN